MNQKGGVGKTTTTLNLSHALARSGKRVLALDMDPQAHLTIAFGVDNRKCHGLDEVLLERNSVKQCMFEVRENIHFLPAGVRLGEVEFIRQGGAKRGYILKEALSAIEQDFDYVIIDCPPSAGLIGMNALLAAKEVLIPVSGDFLALHGVSRLMEIVGYIERSLHLNFEKYIVLTRYYQRRKLSQQIKDKLLEYFPGRVLATPIHETVALAESPSFGKTIFEYRKTNRGAKDYSTLADDVIYRRTLA